MKPLAPKTLLQDRYLISRIIGKGGMGEVYLATDTRLGNKIALKRTTVGEDALLAAAFEREARTLAGLRHPALPKVSDHFLEDDEQFLIMDFIGGEDLSQRLKDTNKPFPLNWVLFWADQLLDALAYLHTHKPPIIHRDIKPQNLKLTGDNQIVLLDFGLSKNALGQTKVTTSGSVVGYTPHYAPMEQIRGTGTNAKSDLYALSATLYQLLANSVPPDALTRADAMLANLPDPLRPLTEMNVEISDSISAAIIKGMDMSQDRRYEDARMMQKALRRAYNKMQESMSANTVAFGSGGTPIEEIAPPDSGEDIPSSDAKTEIGINLGSEEVEGLAQNLDSPVPAHIPSQEDMSGEKTEVFNAADLSGVEQPESDTPADKEMQSPNLDATVQSGAIMPDILEKDDSGDVSVADVPLDVPSEVPGGFSTSEVPVEDDGGFVTDFGSDELSEESAAFTPGGTDDFANTEVIAPAEDPAETEDDDFGSAGAGAPVSEVEQVEASVATKGATAAAAKPKTKSSVGKYLGMLFGIGFVLVLFVAAAAGGLWYFSRGSNSNIADPVPTPTVDAQPTPTVDEPTPEPTPEESPGETPDESNSNMDSTIGPIETPTVGPIVPRSTPAVRSTPRRNPVRTPIRRATPRPRKTPRKQPTPRKKKTPKSAGVL